MFYDRQRRDKKLYNNISLRYFFYILLTPSLHQYINTSIHQYINTSIKFITLEKTALGKINVNHIRITCKRYHSEVMLLLIYKCANIKPESKD
ncbi:MAG: hypothetical protein ACI93R_002396 [Flavobacteriales bacterium]|jgi:hypothetical protein